MVAYLLELREKHGWWLQKLRLSPHRLGVLLVILGGVLRWFGLWHNPLRTDLGLLAQLAVYALAINCVVEIWHHGSIFEEDRADMELAPFGEVLSHLVGCTFCLTPWVAAAVFGLSGLLGVGWPLVCILAFARAAHLLNDLTYNIGRTPGRKRNAKPQDGL